MAINKNHEFEELDGVKCSIAERNVSSGRAEFLKELLEWNGFTVVVAAAPPPKAAPKPAGTETPEAAAEPVVETPALFTVGVTHVAFNPTNALMGRLLRTKEGKIVTPEYWNQESSVSRDDIPYFEKIARDDA
jgi:hypothetical protein